MCRLTSVDVVRHPLVARIVDAYDAPGRINLYPRDDAFLDEAPISQPKRAAAGRTRARGTGR
jgi:phosphate starvation-inducible PhoH-like protein